MLGSVCVAPILVNAALDEHQFDKLVSVMAEEQSLLAGCAKSVEAKKTGAISKHSKQSFFMTMIFCKKTAEALPNASPKVTYCRPQK